MKIEFCKETNPFGRTTYYTKIDGKVWKDLIWEEDEKDTAQALHNKITTLATKKTKVEVLSAIEVAISNENLTK